MACHVALFCSAALGLILREYLRDYISIYVFHPWRSLFTDSASETPLPSGDYITQRPPRRALVAPDVPGRGFRRLPRGGHLVAFTQGQVCGGGRTLVGLRGDGSGKAREGTPAPPGGAWRRRRRPRRPGRSRGEVGAASPAPGGGPTLRPLPPAPGRVWVGPGEAGPGRGLCPGRVGSASRAAGGIGKPQSRPHRRGERPRDRVS